MQNQQIEKAVETQPQQLGMNGSEVIAISEPEDLISVAQRRLDTVKKLVELSLKITTERDWVNQDGAPYLVHSGAEKIARLFGVKLSDIKTEKVWAEDSRGKYYIYKTTGKASLPGGVDSIEAIGTCSQRDRFFAKRGNEWKDTIEIDETNIMKASYSNFVVNAITHLLGLRNLTWDVLNEAGINTDKVQKVSYSSEKARASLSKASKGKLNKIWEMCLQIAGGNEEEATKILSRCASFKNKKGEFVEVKSLKDITTDKWVNFAYRKVKDEFEANFQGVIDEGVDDEG